MATAAETTVVEADELVPLGAFDPDDVHLPGIFVHRIVEVPEHENPFEYRTVRTASEKKPMAFSRDDMARRAAEEIPPGSIVNLGIGLPTLVADYLPEGHDVWLHSENGILGMGPFPFEGEEDPQIINAGKQTVTIVPGGSTASTRRSRSR